MMTRPKKNSLKRRVIVDLSCPRAGSVNAGIVRGFYQGAQSSYTLPSIEDAANQVLYTGNIGYIWSADLARAYRQLRACPLSTPLYGVTLDGSIYVDIALPFGCRTSSLACARTTGAVVYLMRRAGFHCLCYLDDFVGIEVSQPMAAEAYAYFVKLTGWLGLALSPEKCTSPCQKLDWLGYTIDIKAMTVFIPKDKLEAVLQECKLWKRKATTTRVELQRLIGRLQHVAKCVQNARRFMTRILAQLRATPYSGRHEVSSDLRLDVLWFELYATRANGLVLLSNSPEPTWWIECDSSLEGGGAFSNSHYFSEAYTDQYKKAAGQIAHLEALNLVAALKALAPSDPAGHNIVIKTDNSATQSVLETGRGIDQMLCACSREIWLYGAVHNCNIQIIHTPGKDLILADALSRAPSSTYHADLAKKHTLELGLRPRCVQHSLHLISPDL